jgi:hypothetical protein
MKLVTKLPKTTKLCYIREHTHESTGAEQAALAQHWRCSAWNNFGHEMNFSSSDCKNWSLMMEIYSPWSFGCCVFGEHCWMCVEHMLSLSCCRVKKTWNCNAKTTTDGGENNHPSPNCTSMLHMSVWFCNMYWYRFQRSADLWWGT